MANSELLVRIEIYGGLWFGDIWKPSNLRGFCTLAFYECHLKYPAAFANWIFSMSKALTSITLLRFFILGEMFFILGEIFKGGLMPSAKI